jgi:hypothetical protein
MLPRPSGGVIFKEMPEGGVLLHTEQEVYFGLNEVGAKVWSRLGSYESFEALCDSVHAEYQDVARDVLDVDVRELLDQLAGFGLLVPADGGDAQASVAPVA